MISSLLSTGAPAPSLPAPANSASSGPSPSSGANPALLSQNFNTFLTLLTTQIQNQDPLSPLDTNQFTQQLVSFSEVEQQINTNKNLQDLISLQSSSQAISALPLIGRTIQYAGGSAPLANGQASFSYTLPSAAAGATLVVSDASGHAVFTGPAQTPAGQHSFIWNGQNNAGQALPPGIYSLAIAAVDAKNQPITAAINGVGTVDGVNVVNNVATFDVGGLKVPMSSLVSIQTGAN